MAKKTYFDMGAKPKASEGFSEITWKGKPIKFNSYAKQGIYYYGGMGSGKTAMLAKLMESSFNASDIQLEKSLFTPSKETIGSILEASHSFWKAQTSSPPTGLSLIEYLLYEN